MEAKLKLWVAIFLYSSPRQKASDEGRACVRRETFPEAAWRLALSKRTPVCNPFVEPLSSYSTWKPRWTHRRVLGPLREARIVGIDTYLGGAGQWGNSLHVQPYFLGGR